MTKSFICKIKEQITKRLKTKHATKLELKLTELTLRQKKTMQTNDTVTQ